MNNIKTVEVIKALPGLEVGDTLTRSNGQGNFELNIDTITENYSAKRYISISQSLLNKEEFKVIDWFEKRKSAKERIEELEKQLDIARQNECSEKCALTTRRINEKIAEFQEKYHEVENNFANCVYSGESEQWADEAMTVYYNMIDLLKKIKA